VAHKRIKLVIFVPVSHADLVRQALGQAGAGTIGNYDFCSFSSRGIGRFRASQHANPAVGQVGAYEAVEEERIEVLVPRKILRINITLEKTTACLLAQLAKQRRESVSHIMHELILESLERRKDIYFSALADVRDFKKTRIAHKNAWK
jgi:hypothetical protein